MRVIQGFLETRWTERYGRLVGKFYRYLRKTGCAKLKLVEAWRVLKYGQVIDLLLASVFADAVLIPRLCGFRNRYVANPLVWSFLLSDCREAAYLPYCCGKPAKKQSQCCSCNY